MANDVTSKVILGLDPSDFRRSIQQVDARLKETSKLFGNLGQAIGAAFAGGQIISFANEAMRLGDELQKVSQGFSRFGGQANLDQLRASTRGLITDLELMRRTTMAGNFGIGIGEMGNLLAFATRRAAETGQSVDYLVESIVTGIGRKSPLILDNLGISAAQLRSKLNGVSVEAASVGEVSRAVGEIATEQLRLMGEAALTATDRIAQLTTRWQNFKAEVGVFFQTATLQAVDTIDTFLVQMKRGIFGMRDVVQEMYGLITDQTVLRMAGQMGNGFVSPGATEPNRPGGAAVFNFGAQPERTIASLRSNLEALNAEFENVQIGSKRFFELRTQIQATNNEIKKLTEPLKDVFVVPTAEAAKFVTKGLAPINTELVYHDRVMRSSVIPAYDEMARMIIGARDQMELTAAQMNLLNAIGTQFGHIFTSSFNAAMENGTNFFEEIGNALKNYIIQMGIAVGVTAALAAIMSSVMPNLSFGKAFKGLAGGTGLGGIFGEGGIIELMGTVKGLDLQILNRRAGQYLSYM
jgi:hypothetical protein